MEGRRTRGRGTLVSSVVIDMAVVLLRVLGEVIVTVVAAVMNPTATLVWATVMAKAVATVMQLDTEIADGSQRSMGQCLQAATLSNQASKVPSAICSSNSSLLNKER